MANSQTQLAIAPLGTREKVQKISIDVSVTAGADTTSSQAYTFEKPFVSTPQVVGAPHVLGAASIKANVAVTVISATAITVALYQVLAVDLATGTYSVEVDLVGWIAA